MKLKLIKGRLKDSLFFYNLRNNMRDRKNYLNQDQINFDDHMNWYKNKIKKNNYLFLKINFKNKDCGYLRAKNNRNNSYISISLLPKFRKKQIAIKSLIKFEKIFHKNKVLYAEVLKNNNASLKLFYKAGYRCLKVINNKIIMRKIKDKKNNIIKKIEKIRSKNNTNWMDLLRLSYDRAPNETANIMSRIYKDDAKISKLVQKLIKKKN